MAKVKACARALLSGAAGLSLALLVSPSELTGEPSGRAIRIAGLNVTGIPAAAQRPGPQNDGRPETNLAGIAAPGTDPTMWVPGSTVKTFGQSDFLRLGSVLLRPSARVFYMYESNLSSRPGTGLSDHSIAFEPTIEAFIPVTRNGIRADYTFGLRDYKNFDLRHRTSHTFNADSQLDVSPILSLALRDRFVLSTLEAREFVPGRELVFSDARFRRNDLEAQLAWAVSEGNSIGLTGGWNTVSFDEPGSRGSAPFYDYNQYRAGGFYRRDVSKRSALFANGLLLRNETDDPRDLSDSRGYEAVGGLESMLTPLVSGQFSAGFRRERYPTATHQNFLGAVFRGNLQKEFTESARVSVAFTRTTNPSVFQRNAYYLTHGIGIAYFQELGENVYFSISPGYQRNSYPELLLAGPEVPDGLAGRERRRDRILDLALAARYRLNEWVAVDFRFDVIDRDSVLPEFRFTNYRAGVGLLVGQRGAPRGRNPY